MPADARIPVLVGLCLLVACRAAGTEAESEPPPDPELAVVAPVVAEPDAIAEQPVVAVPTSDPEPEPEPEPPAHVHADVDPDNDEFVGPPEPLEGCHERLTEAGVSFKKARIGLGKPQDGVITCGAEQVVRYRGSPESIEYSRAPLLTCRMALALADFEAIVQEEAQRELGTTVRKIDHLGTYNCRKMVAYDLISEHSFANGIDLRRFHLADDRTITVLEHFLPDVDIERAEPETRFLRRLSQRLYDEGVFSVVVTPYFDRLHRNHIHVDLARYRVDGSRP